MGTREHSVINLTTAYLDSGHHLRALVRADCESVVPGMDEWRTVLRDEYVWLRDRLFGGTEFRYDGIPCVAPEECLEAGGAIDSKDSCGPDWSVALS